MYRDHLIGLSNYISMIKYNYYVYEENVKIKICLIVNLWGDDIIAKL